MAKIYIRNNRPHDITLNVLGADPILIPAAIDGPEGKAPGTASADDAIVAEAKKSEVVAFYFDAGWLEVMKEPKAKKAAEQPAE